MSAAVAANQAAPTPRILVVGGIDPCGGAGITADARSAASLGAFPLTVATCVTVQNRHGFTSLHLISEPVLRRSLSAVAADGPLQAVKLGLVGVPRYLDLILELCREYFPGVPIVVDPVLSATSGGLCTSADLDAAYQRCLPRIDVLTPNHDEARRLFGAELDQAGRECAVLLTDGHGEGATVEDLLCFPGGTLSIRHPRLDVGPVHGTGCALSTGLAVGLAQGLDLEAACHMAVAFVATSLARTERSTDGLAVPLRIG